MVKNTRLTEEQVSLIHMHLDRHLEGQRKALAKWEAMSKLSDEPAILTNLTYCRWSIKFLGMLKKTATQRIGKTNAGKRRRGNAQKRA